MHHRDDADEGHAHATQANNANNRCTVRDSSALEPFWFLNYCSPDDRSRPTIALLRPNMLQPFSAGGASLPLITFLVPPPLLPQQQAKIRPWIRKGEERTIAERRADNNDLEKFCTGIRCNIRGGRVELLFPRAEERRW